MWYIDIREHHLATNRNEVLITCYRASLVAQFYDDKESTYNTGDQGSVPELGGSLGEPNDYPL